MKYGLSDPQEDRARRFFLSDAAGENVLLLSGSTQKGLGFARMIAAGSSIPRSVMHLIDTSEGMIMWDKDLPLEEVTQRIHEIDALAEPAGLIDKETGVRLPLPKEVNRLKTTPQYRVDNFVEGSVLMVMPGQDPNELLMQFDRSDEMMILQVPSGGYTIIRKIDAEYFQERWRRVFEILHERGINFEGDEDLDIETLNKLLIEVDKRLENS